MQCPTCQYRFTFRDTVNILNPYSCSCPACKAQLTLGKQGTLFVVAAAVGGAAVAGLGICLEHCLIVTPAAALALSCLVFIVAAGAGEWYCWRNGILKTKSRPAS